MSTLFATHSISCDECGFSTRDLHLMASHSCDVQEPGGFCEDCPCCVHECGAWNGLLYGSNEAIKARVYEQLNDPDYYDEEYE